MSKGVGIVIVLVLALSGFVLISNHQSVPKSSSSNNITPQQTTKPSAQVIDIQASFAIFTNGTFRVFTAAMYHNRSQDAFIEASNPNLIKVKKVGTTWNDFFATLPFTLTSECLTTGTKETFCTGNGGTLQFYLNGEKNDNALNQEIRNGDKLLVTFGTDSEAVIKQQINKIP